METSENLMEQSTKGQLIFYQDDFLAKDSLLPERERAQRMLVISGLKCLESLKRSNRKSLLAKTLLGSHQWTMAEHLKGYSLTWKAKAMRSKRMLFQLVPSRLGTGETGFGLLPTITATQRSRIHIAIELADKKQPLYKRRRKDGMERQFGIVDHITFYLIQGLIPTIGANENKGSSKKRYYGSKEYRGAKTSEYMRLMAEDQIYLHPSFAEAMMGYPKAWTELNPSEMQ